MTTLILRAQIAIFSYFKQMNRHTDGRTDGRTDKQMDTLLQRYEDACKAIGKTLFWIVFYGKCNNS